MRKRIFFLEGNTDGTVGGSYYLMYDLVLGLDRERFEPVVGFHTDNFLVPKLRSAGIETLIFPLPEPFSFGSPGIDKILSPLKSGINFAKRVLLHGFRLSKFLKKGKFDLVNLNNSITRNHFWMLAAMFSGTRCMTHEMGINNRFDFISRFFGKRLESVVCLSYAIRDNMFKLGVDYPNISVIHCGIDPDRYQVNEQPGDLRRKHSIDGDSRVIGVVGNVKYWKGQETIVRAMALLKDEFPDLKCILVGGTADSDMEYLDRQKNLCNELGIEDAVIFAGFQKNAIDYMNMMDIVVHTSVDPEPFGIVTLEALSLSKPYISTTVGGPAEVIENGKSGLLVDPGRPDLLADAIRTFLRDPDYALQCAINGNKRLLSDFTFDKNLEQTVAVYDRILDH